MASKLTPLSTSYHSFQTDQVLTEAHLNEFLNYFDDQTRLSRVMLSGVGLACGFEVRYESGNRFATNTAAISNVKANAATKKLAFRTTVSESELESETEATLKRKILLNPRIVIKQGVGVTTDGDELHLLNPNPDGGFSLNTNEIAYTHYKPFEDTNAHYSHFGNDSKILSLYELVPTTTTITTSEEKLLTTLPDFTKMVVLLYLEAYQDEGDLCSGLSCDSQGINEVANLRVLLVSQDDAAHILKKDSIFNKHDLLPTYSSLDDLSVQRVVLAAHTSDADFDLTNLYSLEKEAKLINRLKINLEAINTKIGAYLPKGVMARIISNIDLKLSTVSSENTHFQYRYDLLKDVVDTYNELKEYFLDFSTECLPNLNSFPKHLMLGIVQPTNQEQDVKKYRHSFYKSSLFDSKLNQFKSFTILFNRLDHQLNYAVNLPSGRTSFSRNEIRLTPSTLNGLLGNRAIPYYYDLTSPLLRSWSLEKTFQNKFTRNLSYHVGVLDNTSPVQNPLQYNMDKYDFLRIEGHQGKELVSVMTEIDRQRIENGLAFDLKAVALDVNNEIEADYDKYACQFEDLQVMLDAWQQEQECALTKSTVLLSSFSIVQPGINLQEPAIIKPIGTKGKVVINQELIDLKAELGTKGSGASIFTPAAKDASPTNITKNSGVANLINLSGLSLNPNVKPTTGFSNIKNYNDLTLAASPFRAAKPVVVDSLAKESETVGAAVQFAVANNTLAKPNDLILAAEFYAQTLIDDFQVKDVWLPTHRNLFISNSISLLAYARSLNDSIPSSIPELNTTVIADYEERVKNLCTAVQKAQLDYANLEGLVEAETKNIEQLNKNKALFNMAIGTLANVCCTIGKIQSLLDAIEKRKESILSQLLLKSMVEKHPSLEHFGGVKTGGTFVLVYRTDISNIKGVPSIKRVIADFSLPYLCCSDCAPIQFIVEQPKVKLKLPTKTLCLETQVSEIENPNGDLIFQVEPVDGEIKSSRDIPGLTIDGVTLCIDPSLFPEAEYGEKIEFTVNQQLTDCTLKVQKLPDATFAVPESPVADPEITFVPKEEHPEGTFYEWSFGDGNTSTEREPTHIYVFEPGKENQVLVSLTVKTKDGACVSYHSENITIVQRGLKIEGNKTSYCKDDKGPYTLIPNPEGAGPITWNGGEGTNFVPSEAIADEDGFVAISVDGEDLLFIQLCEVPVPSATVNYSSKNLDLKRTGDNVSYAEWNFINDIGETVAPAVKNAGILIQIPIKQAVLMLRKGNVTAVLKVANKCCEKTKEFQLLLPAKDPTPTATCESTALSAINLEHDAFKAKVSDDTFTNKFTKNQKSIFALMDGAYETVLKDPAKSFSGNANDNLMENYDQVMTDIYDDLISNDPTNFQESELIILFANVFNLFVRTIQCQPETHYGNSMLKEMFSRTLAYLDKNSEISYPSIGMDINPDKVLIIAVNNALIFRDSKSASHVKFLELVQLINDL